MSSRIIRLSAPNRASVSARASSVLPTPVGPRNRKLPTGRFGSPSPARDRRTASATAATASSWPMTRSCRCCSSRSSRSFSSSVSWRTGMPVARETTSAMSAAVTSGTPDDAPVSWSSCWRTWLIWSRSWEACSYCSLAMAWSLSRCSSSARRSSSRTSRRGVVIRSRTRAPAWSMRSIALSGRKRSVM